MTTEAREVAAPESVTAPQHVMSEEGKARLAALEQQPTARPADPNILQDADGGKANTATGEYFAPERPPQPENEVVISQETLDAIEPLAVSDRYREEAEGYRHDAAAIAQDTGIPTAEVNALYALMGGLAAERLATDASDAVLSTGQVGGPTLWNEDSCRAQILQRYGPMGEAVLKSAAEQFAQLPERVRAYLDQDLGDGSRLGNHPAVVAGLALRAFAGLSPEAAAKELAGLKSSKDYWAGDKLTVDKVRLLSHIVANSKVTTRDGQPVKVFGTRGGDDVMYGVGPKTAAELRAELAALNAPKSDLWSLDGQKRKRAAARRQQIQEQLARGAK